MQQDFSEPQKQSASGIILMFVNTLQKVVRAIALPIIFLLIRSKNSGHLTFFILAGSLLLLIVLAIFAYIKYHRFSFFLNEEKQEFVINQGVFNRTTLSIQLNKIQQVNISQSLLQQFIGVYSVDIDTAGSEKKEASIKAVDHITALELKQRLIGKDHLDIAIPDTATIQNHSDPNLLLKISTSTLFKVGMTSNYGASVVLLGGFILGLIQLFKDYTAAFEMERDQLNQVLNRGFTFFSMCFLILFALFVVLVTNIIRTFIKYFNFQILRQKEALAVSSGLFTKKNTLLKPKKVQLSAYSQNYFQKKFHLLNIKIKQAAYDTVDKDDRKKTDIEIPGCDLSERNEILRMIYQQIPESGRAFLPNYRYIFLQVMIWITAPLLVFFWLGLSFYPQFHAYFILAIPYTLLAGIMLYFDFKRHRLYVNEHFIIKRSGIWDVAHQIIEPHKIQAITANQYFWHKKADIGHLTLHTAAGMIHFKYGNYTEINTLINNWLYQVESSKKDWN